MNVQAPLHLDVLADAWADVPRELNAIFCANLLHTSPWATCAGLMRGAARHLSAPGLLLICGPFVVDGEPRRRATWPSMATCAHAMRNGACGA